MTRKTIGGAAALAAAVVMTLGGPTAGGEETVVFSSGCFWGVQAVFEHVRGVIRATAGYAGGAAGGATYDQVSSGGTGHAESVEVVYDPSQVSFDRLLQVFFSVAHDPTQLNRQGPDVGPQYRSAIWYTTDAQRLEARAYIDRLAQARTFPRPIVTELNPLGGFYPAEEYHQDYLFSHRRQPYIVINDLPKLKRLERELPDLWRDPPVRWHAAEAASR
jgi:peptide-methionine (S)-S-oxide reductase